MQLLIVTQKVDKNDPILGFFHRWIEEFSKRCQSLVVICLEEGEYHLPENVRVLSLGKGEGASKLEYVFRFYKYIWQERGNYDSVFVHMNQEYVLLAGDLWRLMGKNVMLWRNHAHGTALTKVAVTMADKVFCTSPHSYTAQFKKTSIMPVGIDTDFFKPDPTVARKPNSVLFLGRISPVKRVLEFMEWLKDQDFETVTVAGSALPKDAEYEKLVRDSAPEGVDFIGSVTQDEARKLYLSHDLYVNMTPAGSFDKTIFEAAACSTRVKVDNPDLKNLEKMSAEELRTFVVNNHSLGNLVNKVLEVSNE